MDLPARAFSSVVRRVLRFQLPSRKSPRTKPTLWSVVESSSACSRFQAETSLTQLVYHTGTAPASFSLQRELQVTTLGGGV